jgi:hypothetical protein
MTLVGKPGFYSHLGGRHACGQKLLCKADSSLYEVGVWGDSEFANEAAQELKTAYAG